MDSTNPHGSQLRRYRLRRLTTHWELTPLNGALLYLVVGVGGVYLSDVLFVRYFSDPLLSQLQALKAGMEVLLTSGLIFGLIRASRYPLEQSNRQLERRQEELQLLHRVLRHNLRNDLNTVMAFTEMLQETVRSDTRDDCERIRQAATNILHYTQQANRIRRVTEQNEKISDYDLTERIPSLLEQHEWVNEDVELSVDLPDRAVVDVNHMFDAAIEELVTNAIRHSERERPRVSISVRTDGEYPGMTEVSIADNGPGIPEYVPELLGRTEHDQVNHLTGMGLWLVYWTVIESEGTLLIEESDLGGSRVRIWVPQTLYLGDLSISEWIRYVFRR